ncbi:hypothetical protein J31TS4_44750 [Paenibacillus sp. J31TS4]|uniref:TadE/TadG family type IV pilus assembly protein n=1 Tax=Paenibacillus sp. J31TS4 TaxID=2807195 RepID=UPI001B2CA498|nr:TadE/TadG family type IV pilus assembly protein [Paenibacillus sp. J31TS4]GIP41195.1 hypothetical protein J31TS4_44750 [Paenibacillus sp. J31TS4]
MPPRHKRISDEKGAVSIEFLGVLPYFFLFFLLLWQAVASGYAVVTARSAANEAAKVYAMTKSQTEAEAMARTIIGGSENLQFQHLSISPSGKSFELKLETSHGIVFIPEAWRPAASLSFTQTAAGRVIE